MKKYLQKVGDLIPTFYSFSIQQVSREENARADALSKVSASTLHNLCAQVFFEVLEEPSISNQYICCSWMLSSVGWTCWSSTFMTGLFPLIGRKPKKYGIRPFRFILYENKLYRRSFSLPLLKCLWPSEEKYALQEVHKKIYGNHLGGKALSHKILWQRYYWPMR